MLFLIFILLFVPALIKAIFGIISERKKRERANEKWLEFQEGENNKFKQTINEK